MAGDLEDLELRLKIKAEGKANLDETAKSTKAVGTAAESAGSAIDQLTKLLNEQTKSGASIQNILKAISSSSSTYSEEVKRQAAATLQALGATKDLENATKKLNATNNSSNNDRRTAQIERETAAIEKQIRAIERQGKIAASRPMFGRGSLGHVSRADELGEERDSLINKLKGNEAAISRVRSAYDKLIAAENRVQFTEFDLQRVLGRNNALLVTHANVLKNVASALGPVGLVAGASAAAVIGLGVAAKKLASSMAESALEIRNFSLRTGLSIEGAQEFIKTAQLAGVNAATLASGMRKLSSSMADSGLEGKQTAEALHKLGVSAYDAATGQLRSMDEVLPEIFEKLKQVKNQADRNVIGNEILGRSYRELTPLIDGYKKYAEAVQESGVVIDKDGIEKAEEYRESLERVSLAWEALTNKLKRGAVGVMSFVLKTGENIANDDNPNSIGNSLRSAAGIPSRVEQQTKLALERANKIEAQRKKAEALAAAQKPLIDANNAQIDKLVTSSNRRGDEYGQVDQLTEEIKKKIGALKKDVLPSVNAGAIKEIQTLIKRRDAIEANIKSEKQLEQATKRVQELEEQSYIQGLTGMQKVAAERKKAIDELGKSASLVDRINKAYDRISETERNKLDAQRKALVANIQYNAIRESITSKASKADQLASLDSTDKYDDNAAESGFQRRLQLAQELYQIELKRAQLAEKSAKTDEDVTRAQEEFARAGADYWKQFNEAANEREVTLARNARARREEEERNSRSIREISIGSARNDVTRGFRGARAIAGFNNQTDPVRAVKETYALEQSEIQRLGAIEQSQIDMETDAGKRRIDTARLEADIRQKSLESLQEAEMKLLEIRLKEKAESDEEARGFYQALRSGNPGEFFQRMFGKLSEQLFVNATSSSFHAMNQTLAKSIGGQTDANGNKTFLGKLFQGTILENKETVEQTQISAIKDNTVSLQGLTTAIKNGTSRSVGQSSLPSASFPIGLGGLIPPGSIGSSATGIPGATSASSRGLGGLLGALIGPAVLGIGAGLATANFVGPDYSNRRIYSSWSGFNGPYENSSRMDNGVVKPQALRPGDSRGTTLGIVAGAGTAVLAAMPSILHGISKDPSSLQSLGSIGQSIGRLASGATNVIGVGAGHGISSVFHSITGGDYSVSTGDGTAATASSLGLTSKAGRLGSIVGAAGLLFAGTQNTINSLRQGGARGTLGAIGSITGTAAALDPEPISKAVLATIATGSELIKSVFGDPKKERADAIQQQLEGEVYQQAPTISSTQGNNGTIQSYGKFGTGLTSSIGYKAAYAVASPYMVQDPTNPNSYISFNGRVLDPYEGAGGVGSQYPTPPPTNSTGTQVNVTIQAIDSKSFLDHSPAIASALQKELKAGNAVGQTIQSTILGS